MATLLSDNAAINAWVRVICRLSRTTIPISSIGIVDIGFPSFSGNSTLICKSFFLR
jgi:hypothetical protein